MTVNIDVEAFKKTWFSFEEIQRVSVSMEDFTKTWVAHSMDDVFGELNTKIFSKYSVPCTK